MKLSSLFAAAAVSSLLLAGPVLAQSTAAPAAKTDTAAPADSTTKKASKPRSAASLQCSKDADEKGLHGKDRKTFMKQCKQDAKAAAGGASTAGATK
jgi:hypothetical protein